MKSRLAAVSYPLYAGGGGRRLGGKSVTRLMASVYDESRMNRRCSQAQGFERFTHSSAVEDDDNEFTELAPEISESSIVKIKLATEKPEHYVKANRPRKGLVDQPPSSSDPRVGIKDLLATIGKTSKPSNSKTTLRGTVSTSINEPEKISNVEASSSSVSIKNIPPIVSLSELVDVVSKFGEVSGASFVTAPDEIKSCNVVFKDEDSGRKAISTGKVSVKGQVLSIQSMEDGVSVFKVRIKNINKETNDYAIHSQCMSVGELVGLSRTSDDIVDAFFNVRDDKMNLQILSRLNNTKIDRNRWSAHVITSDSPSSEVCSSERAMNLRIFDHLSELRKEIELRKVHLKDLERLNESIMHMRDLFSSIDPLPKS